MNITESFKGFALLGAEWVMWVLVVLSLVSIAIMIERVIYFFGQRPNVALLIDDVRKLLRSSDFAGVRKRLEGVKGVAPAVALNAMAEVENGPEAVDEAAASAMIRERLRLERNLAYLGTVGNNAPFVGLFGTVIGIIQAFNELSLNTSGGASAVMSGISEALVATAVGLLVAIPAVAAFNTFQRRIKALLGDADALVHTLLSGLKHETIVPREG
jgi:biopolymer transport protein ExbB